MKQLHLFKVDEDGFPIDTIVVEFDDLGNVLTQNIDDSIILTPCSSSFHKPRWDGEEWVEDMLQEEIDELNKPQSTEPSQIALLQEQVLQLQEYIVNQEKESLLMKGGIIGDI